MTDRLAGMLGLCRRARKLLSGTVAVEKALSAGQAFLVLVDENMAEGSREKLIRLCGRSAAELRMLPGGYLETVLGEARMCACVTDAGFTQSILKLMN